MSFEPNIGMRMAFAQRLRQHAAAIEARLAGLLDGPPLAGTPPRLRAAMRHGVLAGGKRFRPFLVIETACLLGLEPGAALEPAAAIECVHCSSLVHDDLPAMDNDEVRRGQPTVWKAYDEATAILAGDALLTLAFEIMAGPGIHADAAIRASLVAGLARASGAAGMAGGQQLDLDAESATEPGLATDAGVARIQAMKTGALIAFSCEAGAVLGGASATQRTALIDFGWRLGEAFQIADDLLDVEGDAAIVGKATAKDAAAGKATFVSVLGVAGARQRLAETEARAIAALAPFGAAGEVLVEAARFVSRRQS
jgi:farnesyl diphosphate synthase